MRAIVSSIEIAEVGVGAEGELHGAGFRSQSRGSGTESGSSIRRARMAACLPFSFVRNNVAAFVAREAKLLANRRGIVIDAAFLDFESADPSLAQVAGDLSQVERQDFVDFEARQCRVVDRQSGR